MSYPLSNRCVAKLCRKEWQFPGLIIFAFLMADFTLRWSNEAFRWCLRVTLERGSIERLEAGKTNCQAHVFEADGYLISLHMASRHFQSLQEDLVDAVIQLSSDGVAVVVLV